MGLLRKSNTVSHRKRTPLQEKTEDTGASEGVMQKLDLLLERNQYLEKEYARMARQLKEDVQTACTWEKAAAKTLEAYQWVLARGN